MWLNYQVSSYTCINTLQYLPVASSCWSAETSPAQGLGWTHAVGEPEELEIQEHTGRVRGLGCGLVTGRMEFGQDGHVGVLLSLVCGS